MNHSRDPMQAWEASPDSPAIPGFTAAATQTLGQCQARALALKLQRRRDVPGPRPGPLIALGLRPDPWRRPAPWTRRSRPTRCEMAALEGPTPPRPLSRTPCAAQCTFTSPGIGGDAAAPPWAPARPAPPPLSALPCASAALPHATLLHPTAPPLPMRPLATPILPRCIRHRLHPPRRRRIWPYMPRRHHGSSDPRSQLPSQLLSCLCAALALQPGVWTDAEDQLLALWQVGAGCWRVCRWAARGLLQSALRLGQHAALVSTRMHSPTRTRASHARTRRAGWEISGARWPSTSPARRGSSARSAGATASTQTSPARSGARCDYQWAVACQQGRRSRLCSGPLRTMPRRQRRARVHPRRNNRPLL